MLDVPEKVNAMMVFSQSYLVWVECKMEVVGKKFLYDREPLFELFLTFMHKDKVVCIADVVRNAECLFHELIERVHVDIRKELAREISNRHAWGKAINDGADEPQCICIINGASDAREEYFMIDKCKEFFNVTLEDKTRLAVILAHSANHPVEAPNAAMRSLIDAAGVRVVKECFFEKRIQSKKECMVHDTVADACLMDLTRFWIVDDESVIWAVAIRFFIQCMVQRKNMLLNVA